MWYSGRNNVHNYKLSVMQTVESVLYKNTGSEIHGARHALTELCMAVWFVFLYKTLCIVYSLSPCWLLTDRQPGHSGLHGHVLKID